MKAQELRRLYIDFFVKKHAHAEIKGASLMPENDPTVLFTTAGMHPLVPFLVGEKHPSGTRLVDVQKCVRTDDIEEVGDKTHLTFFEMLGNWSLGDYFKEGAIKMSYEFLTSPREEGGLGLDANRLAVSCFEGDKDAPLDEEAATVWEELGFIRNEKAKNGEMKRIFFYPKKENWWGPAGQTGPCGPDTEIFYFTGEDTTKAYQTQPSDDFTPDGKQNPWVEIWNNVFMQFNKTPEGNFETLAQQNVDTGMGLERVLCILSGKQSPFETELFWEVVERLQTLSGKEYFDAKFGYSFRVICDHLRAATFIIGDQFGVGPSNKDQGYIVRRLIRRAIRHAKRLEIDQFFTGEISKIFVDLYKEAYPELDKNEEKIMLEMSQEEEKFRRTMINGEKEFEKAKHKLGEAKMMPGEVAFKLYDTYGFPIEMTQELAKEHDLDVDMKGFQEAFDKHQELSRAGASQKFAGGLADHSEETTKLHTATHLLHQALKLILGEEVEQKGSNITAERLRFDFNYPAKLTPEQIKQLEDLVNEQIKRDLQVTIEEVTVDEAKDKGAIGLFESKYGNCVKVYRMGDFSYEICGGPHVEHTGTLKGFKITKEEAVGTGVRRIKAVIG